MSMPEEGFLLHDRSGTADDYLNGDARAGTTSGGKQSLTIDDAALRITGYDARTMQPLPGWGPVGQAYTVTYAFRSTGPSTMPSGVGDFTRFNTQQIVQTEQALTAWSDVANIRFTRVGSGISGEGAYSNNATILFTGYGSGQDSSAGFTYFPGNPAVTSNSGDVWIRINVSSNSNPVMGNYGAQVLVHEIGHAIGLLHPGEYDSQDGLPFSYANDAEYFQDTRQYTVMSYFSERNAGGEYGGRYASAPQLDDIRAAQLEYGANMTTRTGDTVYGFNATAERAWFAATSAESKVIFAVWDAGGRDTFDFSGFGQNQVIDLRAGHFSDVGGLVGNVAIAQGVTIENAIGGSGADTIQGNAADNLIDGGAGDDRIYAGAGNDTVVAGAGNDTVVAIQGVNTISGGDGDDSISGGIGTDTMNGNVGSDTLSGGLGDDVVYGGKNDDRLFGDEGADFMNGNLGCDTVSGGAGDDILLGGQQDDLIYGDDGDDYLSGDRGNDTLVGGAGADVFKAFIGSGVDRVLDFRQAEGDVIVLEPGTPWSVYQDGADTILVLGDGQDRMILVGVDSATLGRDSLGNDWIIA
jgi:serralysin